ncbi:thiazole-phosphate synthase [Coriobacterium glomerans PW2]|uniref:thiazole synthase n=1 Tax=Coriobacterium glomerans (strain ATCC 49209 / DSM 20642 / JCM 10262 / PW2) TaxID=700015 RepID=F2N7A4_CORGP|nr:thiazole synthase [Coriobacterium glomerans]AEB06579.1 thiazole-phosphate synthase [Coriobacterium glomerans PW2]
MTDMKTGAPALEQDSWQIAGKTFTSRFILGSGKYSNELVEAAVRCAGAQIVTVAVRRAGATGAGGILEAIPAGVTVLPNTSGSTTAEEAVRTAALARELGCGDLVKLEVIPDPKYLMPDNAETVRACASLVERGFTVLPYVYPDLNTARELEAAGAAAIMPLGSPIGSNRGLLTREFIRIIIDEINLPVIVDAGLGRPSEACEAMEMGATACMVNTGVATAGDVARMAWAFGRAIEAGRQARLAGPGRVLDRASASSPITGVITNQAR